MLHRQQELVFQVLLTFISSYLTPSINMFDYYPQFFLGDMLEKEGIFLLNSSVSAFFVNFGYVHDCTVGCVQKQKLFI